MEILATPTLAYQVAAMMLMLAEVNFFCEQTGVPHDRPFDLTDVRSGSHIGPPFLKSFGGSVLTDKLFFGFGSGHLANYWQRQFMPGSSDQAIRSRNLELSMMSSLIDEGEAVHLATNWLAALNIDLPALEEKYRREIVQWRFHPDGPQGEVLMLPVYQIEWRGNILRSRPNVESAVVTVTVFGVTKEMVKLSILDDSLFLRPAIKFEELKKLLDVPDEEFRTMSNQARSNLVMRAAGAEDLNLPAFVVPDATNQKLEDKPATNSLERPGSIIELPPRTAPK